MDETMTTEPNAVEERKKDRQYKTPITIAFSEYCQAHPDERITTELVDTHIDKFLQSMAYRISETETNDKYFRNIISCFQIDDRDAQMAIFNEKYSIECNTLTLDYIKCTVSLEVILTVHLGEDDASDEVVDIPSQSSRNVVGEMEGVINNT